MIGLVRLMIFALAVGSLSLSGCSYSYPVDAVVVDGKLHFRAREKMNGCLNDFSVISETGEIMWAIKGAFRSSPCEDNFPIAYGAQPSDFETRVTAKPLQAGVSYAIEGSDGDRYYGRFKYRMGLIITNTPDVARAR